MMYCQSRFGCEHISCRHIKPHNEQDDCKSPCLRDDGVKGSICEHVEIDGRELKESCNVQDK